MSEPVFESVEEARNCKEELIKANKVIDFILDKLEDCGDSRLDLLSIYRKVLKYKSVESSQQKQ